MVEGSIVTIGVLAWLFLKLAQEGELRQELLERGLDSRSVSAPSATEEARSCQEKPDSFTITQAPKPDRPERRTNGDTARAIVTPELRLSAGDDARLCTAPIPGNAEFAVYVIVLFILALVAIFDNQVSADRFVWAATWVTVGYFISRGLAKATRVLEQ